MKRERRKVPGAHDDRKETRVRQRVCSWFIYSSTTHHNIIGSFSSLPRTEAVEERDHDLKIIQGKTL